jgi:hypothetical protein
VACDLGYALVGFHFGPEDAGPATTRGPLRLGPEELSAADPSQPAAAHVGRTWGRDDADKVAMLGATARELLRIPE